MLMEIINENSDWEPCNDNDYIDHNGFIDGYIIGNQFENELKDIYNDEN